ncbi:hypothetical protein J6590_008626 [Homalodisca vitripennis]|nr:hypothetical protein J6590_008626 [Homalodisca vitripennis]
MSSRIPRRGGPAEIEVTVSVVFTEELVLRGGRCWKSRIEHCAADDVLWGASSADYFWPERNSGDRAIDGAGVALFYPAIHCHCHRPLACRLR